MARVDIVMPVRNGEKFIGEAIESIIGQTDPDWRLTVFDHASVDATPAILGRFRARDDRIVVHSCSAEMSLSDVRNLGFSHGTAPLIMLHDADDISAPNRLVLQADHLDRHPDLALVGGQYRIIDTNGVDIGRTCLPTGRDRITTGMLFNNPIAQPSVMLRRSIIERLGATYGRSFLAAGLGVPQIDVPTLAEDYLLFGELALLGLCENLPEILIAYRRHESAIGETVRERQLQLSREIARHLMRLLVARCGETWHDPSAFTNFGAELEPSDDFSRVAAHWRAMRTVLARCLPDTPGTRRELTFREILASRNSVLLAFRFALYAATGPVSTDELATIKSIMSRLRPGRLVKKLRS